VTLSLTTSFIAPAPQGRVIVRGRATGGGYKIVYADAVVMLEDETILSTGSGVFKRAA
jgi:acyl-coenzyme A thioesterase PaaI-like protein